MYTGSLRVDEWSQLKKTSSEMAIMAPMMMGTASWRSHLSCHKTPLRCGARRRFSFRRNSLSGAGLVTTTLVGRISRAS